MPESDIREIFSRLNSIERKFDALIATLDERDKACVIRHDRAAAVYSCVEQAKGGWKMLAGISAAVGVGVSELIRFLAGR